MFYYVVLFANATNGFVYHSQKNLQLGVRVIVNFQNTQKIGFLYKQIKDQPPYETKEILDVLDDEILLDSELRKTIDFLSFYYLSEKGMFLRSAYSKVFFQKKASIKIKFINNTIAINKNISLNNEQMKIYKAIETEKFSVSLIFGVTGSGKTEIYLNLIEDVIKKNKKALVLVPEIVLTPQYISIFSNRFEKDNICVFHSRLTQKQKFDEYVRFRSLKSAIMVGTRSCIFTNFDNVGIIVVDEENDESYKQESQPIYNAKDVAIYRAKNKNIPVILCSATPTLEDYFKAKNGKFKLYTLSKRVMNVQMPTVKFVKIDNKTILAEETMQEIEKTKQNKQTTAILLNRRGFSKYLICRECGYVFMCPNCSISLTYHKQSNNLKCHFCESSYPLPTKCKKCGSENIIDIGMGTQKVEDYLKNTFRNYDIERLDRDSVSKKGELNRIIEKLKNGKIDILVGTQILSKGHDISHIGLVIILNAEDMISIPDFRAEEKYVSLIVQTAGRSGRKSNGNVIIQMLSDSNKLVEYVKSHNYLSFLEQEINNRKLFAYPPFSHLIRLVIEKGKKEQAEEIALKLQEKLKQNFAILGKSKCPIYKLKNKYRYHIIIKSTDILKDIQKLHEIKNKYSRNIHFDVDPINFF